MIVFKNYFKIVKKYLPMIIMYTGIFIFFAVISTINHDGDGNFEATKPKVGIINNDSSSLLTKTFIDYTKENAEIVKVEKDEEKQKDALFYRYVDYLLIIPSGFGESILNNNPIKIETMKVADSYDATYTEMLLNRFLNTASIYTKVGMSEERIITNIKDDLKEVTEVNIIATSKTDIENVKYFYNFSNYTFLAICIYIIGMLSSTYNDKKIKKRNLISSTSYKKINMGLILGNFILCFGIWLLYNILTFILYKDAMMTVNGLLYMLNSFVFIFMALALGMLIGNLVNNKEAQSGIVNILALGTSFLCGAFVPQEFLGKAVLDIAHIFPSYWYISANELIAGLSKFDFINLKPIFINIGVVLIFAIGFLIVMNIVTKLKRKDN